MLLHAFAYSEKHRLKRAQRLWRKSSTIQRHGIQRLGIIGCSGCGNCLSDRNYSILWF